MAAGIIYHEDDTVDDSKFSTWLDDRETFESVAKKICGLDYAGITKTAMKGRIGGKK